MIRKTYVADVVHEGQLVGYVRVTIWFWMSPVLAVDAMAAFAKAEGGSIIQIRRLR